jgi:hypothetical protein
MINVVEPTVGFFVGLGRSATASDLANPSTVAKPATSAMKVRM